MPFSLWSYIWPGSLIAFSPYLTTYSTVSRSSIIDFWSEAFEYLFWWGFRATTFHAKAIYRRHRRRLRGRVSEKNRWMIKGASILFTLLHMSVPGVISAFHILWFFPRSLRFTRLLPFLISLFWHVLACDIVRFVVTVFIYVVSFSLPNHLTEI